MKAAHICVRASQDRVRTPKALGCVAGVSVVRVERITERINPKKFGKRGTDEGASDEIPDGTVGLFCYTAKLRSVRGTWHVFDPICEKVGLKLGRDILSSVVCVQAGDDMLSRLLKQRSKQFETLKRVRLEFHRIDYYVFGTIIDEGDEKLVTLP